MEHVAGGIECARKTRAHWPSSSFSALSLSLNVGAGFSVCFSALSIYNKKKKAGQHPPAAGHPPAYVCVYIPAIHIYTRIGSTLGCEREREEE